MERDPQADIEPVGQRDAYTVTDGDGLTASVQVGVTVLDGNRAPFADYSTRSIRLGANAGPGVYEVFGFRTAESPGEGEELAQVVQHQFARYSSEVTEFSLDGAGTLRFRLTAGLPNGKTTIATWATDNGAGDLTGCTGGDANRAAYVLGFYFAMGNDRERAGPCGYPYTVDLTSGAATSVSMALARRVPNASAKAKQLAQVSYAVTLENTGSMMVEGATVTIPAPTSLGNPQWVCTVPVGACVPASGSGPVSTMIDLDLDEVAEIVVTGSVSDTTSYVKLTPSITFAEGVNGAVFGNGIERTDIVSDSHVYVGGFEGRSIEF